MNYLNGRSGRDNLVCRLLQAYIHTVVYRFIRVYVLKQIGRFDTDYLLKLVRNWFKYMNIVLVGTKQIEQGPKRY